MVIIIITHIQNSRILDVPDPTAGYVPRAIVLDMDAWDHPWQRSRSRTPSHLLSWSYSRFRVRTLSRSRFSRNFVYRGLFLLFSSISIFLKELKGMVAPFLFFSLLRVSSKRWPSGSLLLIPSFCSIFFNFWKTYLIEWCFLRVFRSRLVGPCLCFLLVK